MWQICYINKRAAPYYRNVANWFVCIWWPHYHQNLRWKVSITVPLHQLPIGYRFPDKLPYFHSSTKPNWLFSPYFQIVTYASQDTCECVHQIVVHWMLNYMLRRSRFWFLPELPWSSEGERRCWGARWWSWHHCPPALHSRCRLMNLSCWGEVAIIIYFYFRQIPAATAPLVK